jgi:Bacterial protein of unknown function (DUF937)
MSSFMDIVSTALKYLTPMLVDKLATSLGIQNPLVRSAINAILPSLLAAFTGLASRPAGARKLSEAVERQGSDILGDLGSIFGGAKQSTAATAGTDALRDLLGGSTISQIASAVSRFTGVGGDAVHSLMGLVGPVALGTLAEEKRRSGLAADGLANLLAGQKENILAAMPSGFSDLLKGTDLLSAITAGVPPSTAKARPTPEAAKPSAGFGRWPLLLAATAAILIGGLYLFKQSHDVAPTTLTPAQPIPPTITLDSRNLGVELSAIVASITSALSGVKDEASAKAALPRFEQAARQFGEIREVATKLPPDGRRLLASYAGQLLTYLRPLIERALASAGVGAVAKPVFDQVLTQLSELAKA